MYSVENHVGRLIEVRLATPFSEEELDACIVRIRSTVVANPQKIVFAVDVVGVDVLPPETADKFLAMMRADNPKVERAAYFLPPRRAIVGLQLERMIRDAKGPLRKAFRDVEGMRAWLSEALNAHEQMQLDRFLASIA
jgi:hypothetical protein